MRPGSEHGFGGSGNDQCKDLKAGQGFVASRNERKAGLCAAEDRREVMLGKGRGRLLLPSGTPNLQYEAVYIKKKEREGGREGRMNEFGSYSESCANCFYPITLSLIFKNNLVPNLLLLVPNLDAQI